MALTVSQLAVLRRQVGKKPVDEDLQTIFDRVGTLTLTAREVLETRLADLRRIPASLAIPGQYSQSTGDNIRSLEKALDDLGNLDDDDPIDTGDSVSILSADRTSYR